MNRGGGGYCIRVSGLRRLKPFSSQYVINISLRLEAKTLWVATPARQS